MTDTSFGRSEYKIVPFPQSMLCEGHALSTDDKLRGEPPAAVVEGGTIRAFLARLTNWQGGYDDAGLNRIMEPDTGPFIIAASPLTFAAQCLESGLVSGALKPLGEWDDIRQIYQFETGPLYDQGNLDTSTPLAGVRRSQNFHGLSDPFAAWGPSQADVQEASRLAHGGFQTNGEFIMADVRSLATLFNRYPRVATACPISGGWRQQDLTRSAVRAGKYIGIQLVTKSDNDETLFSANHLMTSINVGANYETALSDPYTCCYLREPPRTSKDQWPETVKAMYVRTCDVIDDITKPTTNGPEWMRRSSTAVVGDLENAAALFVKLRVSVSQLTHRVANEELVADMDPDLDAGSCSRALEVHMTYGGSPFSEPEYPEGFSVDFIAGEGEYWVEVPLGNLAANPCTVQTWSGASTLRSIAEWITSDRFRWNNDGDRLRDVEGRHIVYQLPRASWKPSDSPSDESSDTIRSTDVWIRGAVLVYPKIKPYATSG